MNVVHHIELWTTDFAQTEASFDWLFTALGWRAERDPGWARGCIWRHDSGVYVVLEQSEAVSGSHDRTHAGLNHLAVRADDLAALDALRRNAVDHGWVELFADRYPHAGGLQHTALYLENGEGFEVELVAATAGD